MTEYEQGYKEAEEIKKEFTMHLNNQVNKLNVFNCFAPYPECHPVHYPPHYTDL